MEKFYLAALQGCSGIGGVLIRRLCEFFGSAERAWRAEEGDLRASGILSESIVSELLAMRKGSPALPEYLQEECAKKHIKVCSQGDGMYPELLQEIHNPPVVLFYRGTLQNHLPRIAMVGARKVTAYGRAAGENMAAALAKKGFSIVSGAAMGVDTCCHQGALMRGTTEAVLGCGVDVAYPASNARLLAEIAEKGAIISEYLPASPPKSGNFPARNRIISGMSLGTVVVEAARRSGSLITAELALSQGRDVFAVPGSIFSSVSRGCNHLIQEGAKLVLDSNDIMVEYPDFVKKSINKQNNDEKNKSHAIITETEKQILAILKPDEPLSIDEVIYQLHGKNTANAAFVLLQLEFKGLVRTDSLHRYVRTVKEGIL